MENIPLILFGAGYFIIGLGIPAGMVGAQLILIWPIMRGVRPVDPGRRTAAGVIALVSVLSVLPMIPAALSGAIFAVAIVGVLAVVSAHTLFQLHRTSPALPMRGTGGY